MVRIAHDPETQLYFERRVKEGRTKHEVIRILKRYVAHRGLSRYLPRGKIPGLRVWLSPILSPVRLADLPATRRPSAWAHESRTRDRIRACPHFE